MGKENDTVETNPEATPEVTPEVTPENTPEVTPEVVVEESEDEKELHKKADELMEQVGLAEIWFVESANMWYSSEEKASNRVQPGEEFKHFVKSN